MKIISKARFNTDAIVEKMKKSLLAKHQERVSSLRCSEHGNSVLVTLEGNKLQFSGFCCATFKKQVEHVLSQQ